MALDWPLSVVPVLGKRKITGNVIAFSGFFAPQRAL